MKKKILALAMTTIMMAGMMGSIALAGNTQDTRIGVTLAIDSYGYTEGRAKFDTSATYVYLTSVPQVGRVRCMVQGDAEYANTGTLIWYNKNIGGQDVILTNGQWLIRQTVKESGCSNARLRFALYAGNPGTLTGWWSPDSVGSYQYAN